MDSDIKRAIVGSIYYEKWVFEQEIGHKKTGVKSLENFYSGDVLPFELNSKKFIDDLRKIARISDLVTQEPLSRDFTLKYRRTWKKKKE
ncbi:hypothetical protein FBD94_01050 [Pedobacter hiemivivus]|uniref:Uncharacterized protein n=1 Tax=Pedobacter hiemivivus TaxID=2530454 RepID=A0A4V5PEJ0_9SPHI|nr:hypothetical protein [Pedobacter hiemivivus]TKC65176.1 hypothetical protein FBD94_01050 [Pedobacter hiemivivus]